MDSFIGPIFLTIEISGFYFLFNIFGLATIKQVVLNSTEQMNEMKRQQNYISHPCMNSRAQIER
jgi:hypothetical protein